ncbi:MAG: AmmeMemoRadiSam system protein B [Candidatus Aminicenantales bacterium]
MPDMENIPKLRKDIELIPTLFQGQRALLIKDFLGLIQKPVVLEGEALNLLALIDGKRSVREIQIELIRQRGGVYMSQASVEEMLSELDAAYLLENERYRQGRTEILKEYSSLRIRKPSHAGSSYPLSQRELTEFLSSILHGGEGGGSGFNSDQILALVSPHIDLETGKRVYAKAYQSLRRKAPKTIILMGTGHHIEDARFSLTEKDFETPLGLVRTDKVLVRRLKESGGKTVGLYDIAHRLEHSLEFQLIFCQHLFGSEFGLVPILCGSFGNELPRFSRPFEIPGVGDFLSELKEIMEDMGPGVLVVAGVDFSHIGPKFGHIYPAVSLLLETKKHDRTLIDACLRKDIQAFWAESKRVGDDYNVCGFSTLACLLEILPEVQGFLLDYDIWEEEATQSAVSYAALAFIPK